VATLVNSCELQASNSRRVPPWLHLAGPGPSVLVSFSGFFLSVFYAFPAVPVCIFFKVFRMSFLLSILCFDTIGRVTVRTSSLLQHLSKVFLWRSLRELAQPGEIFEKCQLNKSQRVCVLYGFSVSLRRFDTVAVAWIKSRTHRSSEEEDLCIAGV